MSNDCLLKLLFGKVGNMIISFRSEERKLSNDKIVVERKFFLLRFYWLVFIRLDIVAAI